MKDADSIFLVNGRNELERVPHRQYETEELLQTLVDQHPELLVGEQINQDNPPRWIVVKREAGIPGSEDSGNRWSVDHLLLDQNGRPTFVEVKRSSDTRIRREVVGQMLDYAANAQAYWPRDKIMALAVENFGSDEELDTMLHEFLGIDDLSDATQNLTAYWDTVERNLRNGEVRLLFVADEIPSELRRIIEFLNEHMPLVDVLGVEIRQYEGRDIRALVPRVVGQTEFARQQKKSQGRSARFTTKEEFLSACPENSRCFFIQLFLESAKRGYTVSWGTKGFSVRVPMAGGQLASFFYGYPPGVNGSPVPLFQAYLSSISDPDLHIAVQNVFSKHIKFVPKGKHTLQLALNDESISIALSNLSEVLDAAELAANGDVPKTDAP